MLSHTETNTTNASLAKHLLFIIINNNLVPLNNGLLNIKIHGDIWKSEDLAHSTVQPVHRTVRRDFA